MTLAFHAAPPEGNWINDPNALLHADGAYRLFVQHRADAPDFRATGWARFSSPDLLRWTFDGAAIPPDGDRWHYSGSVVAIDDRLEAFLTLHDAASGLQHQMLQVSGDGGASWTAQPPEPLAGAPARNVRDPFVFRWRGVGDWLMLLARPCDWTNWANDATSRLALFRSSDRREWREVGPIGPVATPGVMWEVPLLLDIDGHAVLVVSTIDRRQGGADCAVQAWIGSFDGSRFTVAPDAAPEGTRLDLGPDFYALMASTPGGWPHREPMAVAWLSNWATARQTRWPGFAGGPISLPRRFGVRAGRGGGLRVTNAVPDAIDRAFTLPAADVPLAGRGEAGFDGAASFEISIASPRSRLTVIGDPKSGALSVERHGAQSWRNTYRDRLDACRQRNARVFVDGPLVEIFIAPDGVAASAVLDSDGKALSVSARVGDADARFSWTVPA